MYDVPMDAKIMLEIYTRIMKTPIFVSMIFNSSFDKILATTNAVAIIMDETMYDWYKVIGCKVDWVLPNSSAIKGLNAKMLIK